MRMPPNERGLPPRRPHDRPSMEGGMRMPPNKQLRLGE